MDIAVTQIPLLLFTLSSLPHRAVLMVSVQATLLTSWRYGSRHPARLWASSFHGQTSQGEDGDLG